MAQEYMTATKPQLGGELPLGRDDFSNSAGYYRLLMDQHPHPAVLDETVRQGSQAIEVTELERQAAVDRMVELVTDAEFELVTESIVAVDIKRADITYPPDSEHAELLARAAYAVYFVDSNISERRFIDRYREQLTSQLEYLNETKLKELPSRSDNQERQEPLDQPTDDLVVLRSIGRASLKPVDVQVVSDRQPVLV